MRTLVIATAIGLLMALPAAAGDRECTPDCCWQAAVSDPGCCETGRCGQGCRDCQVVCEMKTVTRHVWVVECVPICPALPRCGHGDPCGCECGGCGKKVCQSCGGQSCCDPCKGLPTSVTPPKCGHQRTVKRLVRKEIECKVPVYKCVPVCRDPGCCDPGCCDSAAPAAAESDGQTTLSAPMPPVIGTAYVK